MVIEHNFVTTLPPSQALTRAWEYLAPRGFERIDSQRFDIAATRWTTLEMRRGSKSAGRNVVKLPQTVRLEWDRGRITVAAAIEPFSAWGGSIFSGTNGISKAKRTKLHTDLLNAIALGLQQLLDCTGPMQNDYSRWDLAEKNIADAAHRRNIRSLVVIVVLVLLCAGLIAHSVEARDSQRQETQQLNPHPIQPSIVRKPPTLRLPHFHKSRR